MNTKMDVEHSVVNAIPTIISAVFAAVFAAVRWAYSSIVGMFQEHHKRVAEIERDYVTQKDVAKLFARIERKIDDGFIRLSTRIDEIVRIKD